MDHSLNLARSWRPQTFDQVIGQELSIRILKNALFKEKWFPVYLFAGQRGCGKTSTARIFAAAVNCHNLDTWRQQPTSLSLPCLECPSCKAFSQANHPDFIEIDAASHTGVDDMRVLTDSASYLPLIARKKVYLIDEAHMLSKSAFNALLKILEEPPHSVIFILATTELHKIPDTIRSRCFQIIFNPIISTSLKAHLTAICAQESISIDEDAVTLIIHESEGSARDAINLLEKVRFSQDHITSEVVLKVLGKISEKTLGDIFLLIAQHEPQKLLHLLKEVAFETYNPTIIWNMLVDLLRSLTWIKYGVTPSQLRALQDSKTLDRLAALCSHYRLNTIMNFLWLQEELFLKTPHKHLFLEMTLLQISQPEEEASSFQPPPSTGSKKISPIPEKHMAESSVKNSFHTAQPLPTPLMATSTSQQEVPTEMVKKAEVSPNTLPSPENQKPSQALGVAWWHGFLEKLETLSDKILISIFKQMKVLAYEEEEKKVNVCLHKDLPFLREKINETKAQWEPLLLQTISGCSLVIKATPPNEPDNRPLLISPPPQAPQLTSSIRPKAVDSFPRQASSSLKKTTPYEQKGTAFDISNEPQWPLANMLAKTFSVKIEKLDEK